MTVKSACRTRSLPDSQKLRLLAGSRRFRFHREGLDVIDGQDGGRDEPWQAEDGADDDEEGDDEQVQMIAAPFL
jgi:hypothetical protein